jgi:hypothetical protein
MCRLYREITFLFENTKYDLRRVVPVRLNVLGTGMLKIKMKVQCFPRGI